MKKFVGVVVVLVGLLLASYYGTGLLTERILKKNLEMVNQIQVNGLSVKVENYNRGWFRSKANVTWQLHLPEHTVNQSGQSVVVAAKDYHIQMPLAVIHGPVIYADSKLLFGMGYARTSIELPPEYVEQFNQQYTSDSVKPHINLNVFVNYLSKTRFRAEVPKFTLIDSQGASRVEWLGMTSHMRISRTVHQVEGTATLEGLNFTQQQLQVMVGKVRSDYDLHRNQNGLYLGDANLVVSSLNVLNAKQKIFEVDAFDVHSSSNIHQGLFDSLLRLALDKLFLNGKFYGPGLVSISIKNLDAQVLTEINSQMAQIQQAPENTRQRALLGLLPKVPNLLGKGAEFNISEFNLALPEGMIKGNLLVVLPKGNLTNPFQLLQQVKGHGRVELAAPILKAIIKDVLVKKLQSQLPAEHPAVMPTDPNATNPMIQPVVEANIEQQVSVQTNEKILALVKSGVLVVQGDHYVITLKLEQGQLMVNGKPFTSAMMQF